MADPLTRRSALSPAMSPIPVNTLLIGDALPVTVFVLSSVPFDAKRKEGAPDETRLNAPLFAVRSALSSQIIHAAASLNFLPPDQTVILSVAEKLTEAVRKKSSIPSYLMRRGAPMSA